MNIDDHEKVKYYFRIACVFTAIILGIGVVFYMTFEHLNLIDAFYFSVVTLATVGYGDITPETDIGKIFTTFYIMTGIGVIATFANLFLKNAAINREVKLKKRNDKKSKVKE